MNMIRHFALAKLAALLFVLPAQAANLYRITDLGILPGHGGAFDINEAGKVVGLDDTRGFLWTTEGGRQHLGHLPGGNYSPAWAINSSGQVAGYTQFSFFESHAFLWTNGVMQDIGDLPGGIHQSEAHDINNLGQVTGWGRAANNEIHAFLWSSTTGMQDLGINDSYAYGINNSGQVVGYKGVAGGNHAFLWTSATGMQDLGDLPGGRDFSLADDINDNDQVVGFGNVATGSGEDDSAYRAFLWSRATGMQELGVLPGLAQSWALGINNNGHIVGRGFQNIGDSERSFRAFLWTSTDGMRDLNDLLHPADSDWIIHQAYAINDAGQIVGYGTNPEGIPAAYLLSPVPEPASLALCVTSLFAIHLLRARRRLDDCRRLTVA